MPAPTKSATRGVAEYIVAASIRDLPSSVLEKADLCLLDTVGCSLAGAFSRRGGIMRELATRVDSGCVIVGGGGRTSPLEAAFCNAMTANALELDDTFDRPGSIMFAHPGATVVPAAMAAAELMGSSGEELLHALVLGYEVSLRIGVAIQPTRKRAYQEVWGGATFQTFGAVVAAAKLFKLDIDQTLDALGIAGSTAPVPSTLKVWRPDHPDLHNGYGWATEAGLRAAMLARRGYTAPHDILDGNDGFWRMYGSDQCDFAAITDGLGADYWIRDVSFKPWPACRWAHPIMDAAKSVIEQNKLGFHEIPDIDNIEQVTVGTFGANLRSPYDNRRPQNLLSGQFSTAYCTAVALMGKQPAEDQFDDRGLADPRIAALIDKIALTSDTEAERLFPGNGGTTLAARLEIRMRQGQRYESWVLHPWGDPRNPMVRTDLEAKLVHNARENVPEERLDHMVGVLRQLRSAEDFSALAERLQ